MATPSKSMTTREFAKATGIPAATISKLIREGKLKARKEGQSWMIPQSQLAAKVVRELGKPPKPPKAKKSSTPAAARTPARAAKPVRSAPTPSPPPKTSAAPVATARTSGRSQAQGAVGREDVLRVRVCSHDLPDRERRQRMAQERQTEGSQDRKRRVAGPGKQPAGCFHQPPGSKIGLRINHPAVCGGVVYFNSIYCGLLRVMVSSRSWSALAFCRFLLTSL